MIRNLLRRWRSRHPRNPPRVVNGTLAPRQYTVFFTIGGKKYYMLWDAWVQDDNGTWTLLTAEQMSHAVEAWVRSANYIHVARSGGNVAAFHTSSIDEWEVIDNSEFNMDL